MNVYICTFPQGFRPDHRAEHICAVRMLRRIYGPDFVLRKAASGKPLPAEIPDREKAECYFSISHCREAVAVLTDRRNNGLDIERRFPWKDSLARKVCSASEYDFLRRLSEDRKQSYLQIIWSRKESYVKYTGEGLSHTLSSFCVLGKRTEEPQAAEDITIGQNRVIFWQLQTDRYTLCTCGMDRPEEIVYLNYRKLEESDPL